MLNWSQIFSTDIFFQSEGNLDSIDQLNNQLISRVLVLIHAMDLSPLSSMSFPPRKPFLQSSNKIKVTAEIEQTTIPAMAPVDKRPVSTLKSTRILYDNW